MGSLSSTRWATRPSHREVLIANEWLSRFEGTQWTGTGELWMDPEGNQADRSECTLRFDAAGMHYTWSHNEEPKDGTFVFDEAGATWQDSFHQTAARHADYLPSTRGIFTLAYEYEAPSGPPWGWRIRLSERPDGRLVLQMVNIAPWGEEARAVRMVFTGSEAPK